ncbi:hypothetical protein [Thermococcus sp.]|uniref:hypothetical protein n=1 Tax=Thermococcus sp. TaxID=35749 RepID=UPI002619832A|nr:hypothetical protein [Thermococcus sp.]
MSLGGLGGLRSVFAEMIGILSLPFVLIRTPESKRLAEGDFKGSVGLLFALLLGNILMYLAPPEEVTNNSWIFLLAPVAYFALGTSAIISYRRLKRFEQEEMLEKLAEKLGESVAKGLKGVKD